MEPTTHSAPQSTVSGAVLPGALSPQPCPIQTLYALDDCMPSTLVMLCGLLLQRGYKGDSAAYVMHRARDGVGYSTSGADNLDAVGIGMVSGIDQTTAARFYLALSESQSTIRLAVSPTAILEEYGTRIASSSMLLCLCEHALCLAPHHAIERIAALRPVE